jgi:hypothetical protein
MNVTEEEDEALHGQFIKCCFRRSTALFELAQAHPDPAVASLDVYSPTFYVYRLAVCDMAACMHHDERNAQFQALQARFDAFAQTQLAAGGVLAHSEGAVELEAT